jgi:3-isopropylmalate/(R)-2-methylmalate dehydratase small subunit
MQPFTILTGVAAALDRANVDTDQIIPKQFLKRIERTGFGQFLFYDWRFQDDGKTPNPDFELNHPALRSAQILLAGRNFGSGSSREHAPWSLDDYGFRCVIAPSFADIFYNNCFQNGLLPIVLDEAVVKQLMQKAQARPGYQLTIDLPQQTISDADGFSVTFDVDPFRKHRMLNGLDDIGMTLQHEPDITAFEEKRPAWSSRVTAA